MTKTQIINKVHQLKCDFDFIKSLGLTNGYRSFQTGHCSNLAIALNQVCKSSRLESKIVAISGVFKPEYAFLNTTSEERVTLHYVVKIGRSYVDINGVLGSKQDVFSNWTSITWKEMTSITPDDVVTPESTDCITDALVEYLTSSR
jgi:hypothetical protein